MIGTKTRFLLFSGVALGVSALCWLALRCSTPNERSKRAYGRDVADGVRVWNPRTGVDCISFESCRVEKLKSGPITFGGLEVLCINGLVVNLPLPEEDVGGVGTDGTKDALAGIPMSLLRKTALPFERVSGLRIRDLSVNRVENRSAVPVFAADEMRNRGRSLILTNCRVFEDGKTNLVRKATLTMTPSPVLAWNGGERRLDDLLPNHKEKTR